MVEFSQEIANISYFFYYNILFTEYKRKNGLISTFF